MSLIELRYFILPNLQNIFHIRLSFRTIPSPCHPDGSPKGKNIYELAEANGYEIIWTHHYELRSTSRYHTEEDLNDVFADAMIDLIRRL